MARQPVGIHKHSVMFIGVLSYLLPWPLYLHQYDQPSSFIQAWDWLPSTLDYATPKAERYVGGLIFHCRLMYNQPNDKWLWRSSKEDLGSRNIRQ